MAGFMYAPAGSEKSARRVFLAVPAYGQVPAKLAGCLFLAHKAIIDAGLECELGILEGNCHVDDSRNRLVSHFLSTECDELMFIDSDIVWSDSELIRVLRLDYDVVGASYPMKQEREQFPVRFLPGEIWSNDDGVIEVEAMPTGFLKIKREVLQTLYDKARKFKVRGSDYREEQAEIFERGIVGGGRVSGDINFCRKARAEGFRVWCDPEPRLGHIGANEWTGNLGSHLRKRNGLALIGQLKAIREGDETPITLQTLSDDWGNAHWSAGLELLLTLVRTVKTIDEGVTVECGSGLSTLAMAAANPRMKVHAIEHDNDWWRRMNDVLDDLKIAGLDLTKQVFIHRAPIDQSTRWYGHTAAPWSRADLVVIDGPPRMNSDRSVAYRHMDEVGSDPKAIIVDDANTELEDFEAWLKTKGMTLQVMGEAKPFVWTSRQKQQKVA